MKKFYLFAITLWFLVGVSKAPAQVNIVWNSKFHLPVNVWEQPGMADQLGNIYVAQDWFSATQDSIMMLKFDNSGNLIWYKFIIKEGITNNYNTVQLYIDSLNCPIITLSDYSSSTYSDIIVKCDTSGAIQWQDTIFEASTIKLAIDKNSNIYSQYHNTTDSTMVLEKRNSSGNLMYQASTFFWSGSYGMVPVIDNNSNVWFGFQSGIHTAMWFKVDTIGVITDSLVISGYSLGPMAFDKQGNMILSLNAQYPPNMNYLDSFKLELRKYDPSMNLLWNTGPTNLSNVAKMVIDNSGNAYPLTAFPNLSNSPMTFSKFDTSGNMLWVSNFGFNNAGLSNYGYADLLIDTSGNPVAIGKYYTSGFITSASADRFFIKRIDPNGVLMDLEIIDQQSPVYINFAKNYGNDLYLMNEIGIDSLNLFRFCIGCESKISGIVYFDSDSSCTHNGSEHGLKDAIIEIQPGPLYLNTDSAGYYHGYLNDNSYNVTFAPYMNYSHSCMINSTSIQIISGIPAANVNSGNYMNVSLNDLQINIGKGRVRPGTNVLYAINYKNAGGSVQTGSIDFVYDSIFNFVQSSPPPDLISGDTLKWNFSGMLQGNSTSIYVTMHTPASVLWGTPYSNSFNINGNQPELSPLDNFILDTGNVQGSFDPNEKSVTPSGSGSQGFITTSDSVLYYTIHFENIGNDTAFTVLVIDTIDSDLDLKSLQMGAVSHSYTWDIVHSNILRFRFADIQLADSSHPDENKGFVNYFIKQKPNLVPGTEIINSAGIYFDYNLPVQTNQTLNTIFDPLAINSINNTDGIILYPNPVSEWLTVYSDNDISEITIFDINGKQVPAPVIGNNQKKLTVNSAHLNQGIYVLKLQTKKGLQFKKVIKI